MKIRTLRFAFGLFAALAVASATWAQSSAVSPPSAPQSSQQAPPVLKAQTVAIPVRVVVRDHKGRLIGNLKKEDFRIYQDGQLEPISNFTAISEAASSAQGASGRSAAGNAAAAPDNANRSAQAQPAPVPERYLALFFDDMHLQSKDLDYTTADADKYLASLPVTDHVAIATASRQGELDFTTNRSKLHDAIMKLKIHPAPAGKIATATVPIPTGCPGMDYWEADAIVNGSGMAAAGVLHDAEIDLWTCSHTDSKSLPDRVATAIVINTAGAALAQADVQTETVLQRIEDLVSSMSSRPGQRVIVLISPGFLYKTHRRQLSDLIDRAIRSDVVVNSIETRRGFNLSAMAQSWNRPAQVQLGAVESQAGSDAETALGNIAHSTGGRVFVGATDYGSAFGHLAVGLEFYYLLAYSPSNPPADGKYHTLKVTLATRSNLTVETRRGFYAPSHAETAEEAATREINDALFSNEEDHGLPVTFETQILPGPADWQNIVVKADVDVLHLDLRNADGLSQDNLRFAVIVFDNDGYYLAGSSRNVLMNLDSATVEQLAKTNTGYHVDMNFYARPGQYTVRLVVRDSNDQRISAEDASVTVPAKPTEKK